MRSLLSNIRWKPEALASKRILGYDDVTRIPGGTSNEPLVDVQFFDASIIAQYNKYDMLPYTGERILVRRELAKRLAAVNRNLQKQGLTLKVVYGYRHPEVQETYFKNHKERLSQESPPLSEARLNRLTHNFVAVPDVAGHPTGGAVDLSIVDNEGNDIDMGTPIADYTDPERIRTFTAELTDQQTQYRKLLHDAMVTQGFAPFYGEWWHFSYGDREWAAFYGKKTALYGAISWNK